MNEDPTFEEAKQAMRECNLWTLHIGIHRGTITSRDSEQPKKMATLQECIDAAEDAFKWYRSIGCMCWFCYAIGPGGNRHQLIASEPYN
jgi:protein tyrosine phosphatase (PTP) superfamily phosphohydrolase (DUF442 family)